MNPRLSRTTYFLCETFIFVLLPSVILIFIALKPATPLIDSPPDGPPYYRLLEVVMEDLSLNNNSPNPSSLNIHLFYKLVRSIPLSRNISISIGLRVPRRGYILLHLANCRPTKECSERFRDTIRIKNENTLMDVNQMIKTENIDMEFRITEDHGQSHWVCPTRFLVK